MQSHGHFYERKVCTKSTKVYNCKNLYRECKSGHYSEPVVPNTVDPYYGHRGNSVNAYLIHCLIHFYKRAIMSSKDDQERSKYAMTI